MHRGADQSLARPGRKQATATKLLTLASHSKKKKSEGCPSNQVSAAAITSASDEKWRPFNCFFIRVGLRTYQHPWARNAHFNVSAFPPNQTSSHKKKSVVKKLSNINLSPRHIQSRQNYYLLLLAELAAHCFAVTKRIAEKFSHDCSTFTRIILYYRLLYATIMKQKLPASIFRTIGAFKTSVLIYQSTWSHTLEELNLHEHCCKIFRCHVGQKILLIEAYSTTTSVDANRYVILYQYRRKLYRQ